MLQACRPREVRGTRPLAFSLEYDAFRELHLDVYLRYARVRTGEWGRATRCVSSALESLRLCWTTILRSDRPAARAWKLLSEQADELSTCSQGHGWNLHCLLQTEHADAVLLHRRLGLSVERTAGLMGLDKYALRALLKSADRDLDKVPRCLAPQVHPPSGGGARNGRGCTPG